VGDDATAGSSGVPYAAGLIDDLAGRIGPRRPGSEGERRAAEFICDELSQMGLYPRLEGFRGPSSFAWSQLAAPALSLVGLRKTSVLLGGVESDMRLEPFSRLFSLRASQNVVAEIPAAGVAQRTLVLVSHLDSSRSGLLFHPRATSHLRALTSVVSAAVASRAVTPYLGRRIRRAADRAAGAILAAGIALLFERELRGEDVPGANDNASGVAVATAIARELSRQPLESTRVIFLATGCEESGTAGMRSFLESHSGEWDGALFLNLDGVGAPATLRYLPREGVGRILDADRGLLGVCERVARDRPDLGLEPAARLVGLTYDATPVMARKGRAITLSAQDESIPNYHTPDDVPKALDLGVLARALEVVRLVAAAIDRGDADDRLPR